MDGKVHYTETLPCSAGSAQLEAALVLAYTSLRGQFSVQNNNLYRFSDDGIDFIVNFKRVQGVLQQFKLWSDWEDPLRTGEAGDGSNLSYDF